MKTYQLHDGGTLIFSVDGGAWETISFDQKDFQDSQAATAEEVASALNRSGSLAAYVDETGSLVLATAAKGGHVSLEIDLANSSTAAALGLVGAPSSARGAGLCAARLVSLAAEPFAMPLGAEMTIIVDEHRRKVTFDDGITEGKATAADVCKVINAKRKKIAEVTRDGRVMLTSPTLGAGSKLEIEPATADGGKPDAAAILGFIGAAAFSQPHQVEAAKLTCRDRPIGLQVINLTASPVELHFATGATVLPADSQIALSPGGAANPQLQRLIEQGVVRLISATGD